MKITVWLITIALLGTFVTRAFCEADDTKGQQPAGPETNPVKKEEPPRPRRPEPLISPQVSADGTVVFRLLAPNAKEVSISGEIPGSPVKLAKDEKGIWSASVGPLPPELYSYSFVVDGLRISDPANPVVKPMRSPTSSILEVVGSPPLLHDFQDVPHGTVRVHYYHSQATESRRRMHVYTPPGYDKASGTSFPDAVP